MKRYINLRKPLILLFVVINLLSVPVYFIYYKQGGFSGIWNILIGIFVSLVIALFMLEEMLDLFLSIVLNYKVYKLRKHFAVFVHIMLTIALIMYIAFMYRLIFLSDGNKIFIYNYSYMIALPLMATFGAGVRTYYINDVSTILRIENRLVQVPNSYITIAGKHSSVISSKMTTLELMIDGSIVNLEVLKEDLKEVEAKLA